MCQIIHCLVQRFINKSVINVQIKSYILPEKYTRKLNITQHVTTGQRW